MGHYFLDILYIYSIAFVNIINKIHFVENHATSYTLFYKYVTALLGASLKALISQQA